jgi:Lipocalin-like domain
MPLTGGSGRLIDTWRLISIQFELADTGERFDLYGPHPLGFLILTDGGRLMGMVTSADRRPPRDTAGGAALFESMMAYSGKYRVEGEDKFITSVDLAWHPAWNGTEQTRFFKLDNDMLSITTAQQTHPRFPDRVGRGVLVWRKE